jgi:hypothetical protein
MCRDLWNTQSHWYWQIHIIRKLLMLAHTGFLSSELPVSRDCYLAGHKKVADITTHF